MTGPAGIMSLVDRREGAYCTSHGHVCFGEMAADVCLEGKHCSHMRKERAVQVWHNPGLGAGSRSGSGSGFGSGADGFSSVAHLVQNVGDGS